MIERLQAPVAGVVGVRVAGLLRHEDYVQLEGWLSEARDASGRTSLVVEMGPLKGWTPRAALDDIRLGIFEGSDEIRRMAIVSDKAWIRVCTRLFEPFIRYEMKVFPRDDMQRAWKWASGSGD